jgi:hypothetical protein
MYFLDGKYYSLNVHLVYRLILKKKYVATLPSGMDITFQQHSEGKEENALGCYDLIPLLTKYNN